MRYTDSEKFLKKNSKELQVKEIRKYEQELISKDKKEKLLSKDKLIENKDDLLKIYNNQIQFTKFKMQVTTDNVNRKESGVNQVEDDELFRNESGASNRDYLMVKELFIQELEQFDEEKQLEILQNLKEMNEEEQTQYLEFLVSKNNKKFEETSITNNSKQDFPVDKNIEISVPVKIEKTIPEIKQKKQEKLEQIFEDKNVIKFEKKL